jgi:hypothetical protein
VYEKERASRIEGRDTDQHNRHCQPTRSSRFYVWGLDPSPHPVQGQARSFIHYSPPPSRFRSLIVSVHTAPSVIHSIRHRSLLTAPTTGPVFLCHLLGSSSVYQQSRLRTQWRTTGSCAIPKPGVLSHFRRCKAQSTSTSALVVHYRVPDLLFLLYRRIYKANALLSSRPEHSPSFHLSESSGPFLALTRVRSAGQPSESRPRTRCGYHRASALAGGSFTSILDVGTCIHTRPCY